MGTSNGRIGAFEVRRADRRTLTRSRWRIVTRSSPSVLLSTPRRSWSSGKKPSEASSISRQWRPEKYSSSPLARPTAAAPFSASPATTALRVRSMARRCTYAATRRGAALVRPSSQGQKPTQSRTAQRALKSRRRSLVSPSTRLTVSSRWDAGDTSDDWPLDGMRVHAEGSRRVAGVPRIRRLRFGELFLLAVDRST